MTPAAIHNRPGLSAIRTRIGTHARFLETMMARLSSADYPELAALRTREPSDASIALLDAWAAVADVLTFYQERIANEGYLRTATERRSLVELARLIGYVPRPGVAASVYLAFGLDKGAAPVVIPKGAKTNSIPGPGETMQAFETSEPLPARFEWSAIRPRLVQPQTMELIRHDGLYLKGTATKLKPGDLLLIRWFAQAGLERVRVTSVDADHAADRTHVGLAFQPTKLADGNATFRSLDKASLTALLRPQTRAPISRTRLSRSIGSSFAPAADTVPQLLASFQPALSETLYAALRNAAPPAAQPIEVYAMRIEARPFGHNAPLRITTPGQNQTPPVFVEWEIGNPWGNANGQSVPHQATTLFLDNDYEVAPDTKIVIENDQSNVTMVLEKADLVAHRSLNAYGISGKSLELHWNDATRPWFTNVQQYANVRRTRVYLGSEKLALADAPMSEEVGGYSIELDGLYEGLDAGRWLIVEGERVDIPDGDGHPIPGIRGAELVMLAGVEQTIRVVEQPTPTPTPSTTTTLAEDGVATGPMKDTQVPGQPRPMPLPGDTYHSTITLAATAEGAAGLAYRYKRDTVIIHANVAHATHGETRTETLGSGNAAEAFQRFLLKQFPLTYVSARTPSGIASTLEVRVNDVLWHEAPTLSLLGPTDRKFATRSGDDEKTSVTFGNGKQGMRLPTGRENVKARYRSGIGAPGNVKAGQISLLGARPLGVKYVVNPLRASGGADRESANAIRRNAPIAIMALDRLLSVTDYTDFARNFGGVGKAAAARVRNSVNVVIAGVDDAPIDTSSDLFGNLKDALHRFGDPSVPVTLAVRERLAMIVKAGVRIDSDYLWEAVEPRVRAAMLETFSFEKLELGAPLFLSHAFRAIQRVPGVVSVDIDIFDAISEGQITDDGGTKLADRLTTAKPRISPESHQIAYLTPAIPETLILQELPS